ncbi:hypothetical protein HHK36_012855 [Tetracentron sinense]|uniref:RRM domain-containing protein n=1 Tax=Tetracentron sinense TaxID=13715 RepID=A0A834ZA22_TETSI|nr:hypothetical protein HHK36_012840 [Tetracentron sinense]KAF8401905.1 hypothetical protein HHK36_012855 [Tetracentron sinense]
MSTASASTSNASGSAQFTYSNGSYFPLPFHLQQSDSMAAQQYPSYLPPPPSVQIPPAPIIPSVYLASAPVTGGYSLPQYQQAQQLFQRDAQTITPEALESVKAALANDYRVFCGDLGNEVNDEVLSKAFSRFPSFNMAKVVRDKRTSKTRGYGFVSFANPLDLAAALKEMNDQNLKIHHFDHLMLNVEGKYVGNRPIKLRKSNWKERTDFEALERQKYHTQKKPKLSKKSVLHK